VRGKPPPSLNTKCGDAGVYNRLEQKQVAVWIGLRNHADHAEFDQYTADDVRRMLDGVTEFLARHLA
jgi:hypothetical protein